MHPGPKIVMIFSIGVVILFVLCVLDHRNTIRVQIRIRVRVKLQHVLRNGNLDHGCGQDLYDHVIKLGQCLYMHCPQLYVWTMYVKARVKFDNKIIQILLCKLRSCLTPI